MSTIQDTVKALRATADQLEALIKTKPNQTQKEKLLKHYADGDPVLFAQFDGFEQCHKDDSMMPGDDRGHCVMGTQAHELRRSGHSVRVQIRSGTDAQTAVILLQKILADVKGTAKREGENAFKFAEQPINDGFWGFSESDEVPF